MHVYRATTHIPPNEHYCKMKHMKYKDNEKLFYCLNEATKQLRKEKKKKPSKE